MILTNAGWCVFAMLSRMCMLKGRTYGEEETPCHVVHAKTTKLASVFNGRNLGIFSIGHGERLINICNHKSEEIRGIKVNK